MSGQSTPIFSEPAVDLAKLTELVGRQLHRELQRLSRQVGMDEPGFMLLLWANDDRGVKFAFNRSSPEYEQALRIVLQDHGYIVWQIGKGK